MSITVVTMLEDFLAKHGSLYGPYDSPELFLEALELFLKDEGGRKALVDAWYEKGIYHAHRTSTQHAARDAFELVYSTLIKGLWPDMGIRSEDQAVQVILSQINNVDNCLTGVDFETFNEIGNTHMPATVERAVDVIAAVMRSAPSSLADKRDINDLERLQVLAKRIARFAEPVPLDGLWGARVRILPNIEMALAGRNTYAAYTRPRRPWNVGS